MRYTRASDLTPSGENPATASLQKYLRRLPLTRSLRDSRLTRHYETPALPCHWETAALPVIRRLSLNPSFRRKPESRGAFAARNRLASTLRLYPGPAPSRGWSRATDSRGREDLRSSPCAMSNWLPFMFSLSKVPSSYNGGVQYEAFNGCALALVILGGRSFPRCNRAASIMKN